MVLSLLPSSFRKDYIITYRIYKATKKYKRKKTGFLAKEWERYDALQGKIRLKSVPSTG